MKRKPKGETPRESFIRLFWMVPFGSNDRGCWIWTRSKMSQGYGNIATKGPVTRKTINYRAHRLSYELHKGPIPNGLHVMHSCDNPACVNPDHLELGTAKDNAKDRTSKGRQGVVRRRGCRDEVLALTAAGRSIKEISKAIGCHRTTVEKIIYKSRRQIKGQD